MKQSLQLKLGQQLAMTPQLQQAIRLLQLSTIELQNEVQELLDSNYMLEAAEDDPDTAPVNGSDGADETVEPVDIPTELAVDSAWEDIYDATPAPVSGPSLPSGDGEFEVQRSATESLHEQLRWQLGLTHFSPVDRVIAESILDGIDDGGYLRTPISELADALTQFDPELGLEEVEAVLHQIHNFDPPGVGARDLRECLLIQLHQLAADTAWRDRAIELVRDHLDIWGARDYRLLQRRMSLSKEELQDVIALVQTLNPRPGSQIDSDPSEYVIPDVIVTQRNGQWHVDLNPESMPRLRINSTYASFVKRGDDSADNDSMRQHLNEARWFMKSLQSRSETLLKVATCIVERQRAFFEHGEEAMKPMVLHDIAEAVSMHESTISRVTTRKYMHTPRGVFELKYFFSSHVSTETGGAASSTAIRALIKKLIAAENAAKPLSDSKLANVLKAQGVNVARRTVAKYRESMSIPASNERKQLV